MLRLGWITTELRAKESIYGGSNNHNIYGEKRLFLRFFEGHADLSGRARPHARTQQGDL